MHIYTPEEILTMNPLNAEGKWTWFVAPVDDGEHLDICEVYPGEGYCEWEGDNPTWGC